MSMLEIHASAEAYKNRIKEDHPKLNKIDHKEEIEFNSIPIKKDDYISKANLLREKHHEIRSGYGFLETRSAQGRHYQKFVEPKVQRFWRMAKNAQFTPDEEDSLKWELQYYETRLLKLRHLHTIAALETARNGKTYNLDNSTEQNIKKHTRTVEKLHADIESRILERHTEL